MNQRNILIKLLLVAWLAACSPPDTSDAGYDVLVVNGTVYDGSIGPARTTNIGINGNTIATLDADANASAALRIDATGLVVVPGFIDPHTHADDDIFDAPGNANTNYLAQGVTTVFIGNDGKGIPDRPEMLAQLAANGVGTNIGFFAGHATIRKAVVGLENRIPTDIELDRMRAMVADEMDAGALGLSTGLFYTPGSFADTEELIELAKIVAGYNGVYDSHMRDESSYNIGLLGSIRELIEIGEKAGIHAHAAHIKALGLDVWGQSGDIIALIEAARERGVAVTADQYPYRASGTRFAAALIPSWVRADSNEAMFRRLGNPDLENRIRREMEDNLERRGGQDSMLVTGESQWRGMTLGEIAEEMGAGPLDAAIAVVRAGNPPIASFNMNPADIDALGIQSWVMTGSDGSTGHPRKFATYPKAHADFVAENSLLTMAQFVHRSSGLVADSFSLCDRGYLAVGRNADIAMIDIDSFLPAADFENPTRLATGVVHLLVNGIAVISDRAFTARLPGTIIDRQNLDCPN